jgi:hypothetical protein
VFTRRRWNPPGVKETWEKDRAALVQSISDYLIGLESKGSLNVVEDEGTWTPEITFTTPGDLSVSYSVQLGDFTKLANRIVMLNFGIVTSAFTHSTASGELRITGMKYPSVNLSNYSAIGALQWGGITKAGYSCNCAIQQNSSYVVVVGNTSGSAPSVLTTADFPTGGTVRLRGNIFYRAS